MTGPERFLSQGEGVSSLLEQMREGTAPHAVLISGEAGTGKWTLAAALAAVLLCQGEGKKPCGHCQSCVQMETLEHPDLIVLQKGVPISPEEKKAKTTIPVNDVREMIRRISVHALEGDRHVVIIRHAEDLGAAGQNALLKTLEEPPEGTFFLLTAVQTADLLPTIISRCRPLKLRPWTDGELIRLLISEGVEESRARAAALAAGGSPGAALKNARDESFLRFREEVIRDFLECESRSGILKISTAWKDRKAEADALFSVLEDLLSRLRRISLRVQEPGTQAEEIPKRWMKFAENASAEDYVPLMDGLLLARKRAASMVNFQAVTEQLILTLMEAVSK